MRVFALSDLHVDYDVNARWVDAISMSDHQNDVLILAGDVSDSLSLLQWCLETLARRFRQVLFVPGNHDLWVIRETRPMDSLEKFDELSRIAAASGVSMHAFHAHGVAIVPLLGWYDYSFGEPSEDLQAVWMDYRACRWPPNFQAPDIAAHFTGLNATERSTDADTVITFSHYLPRIDLMPSYIPAEHRMLYPVLGATVLEDQLRRLDSSIHVYGHSHVNRDVEIDGVAYVNNAFGYPQETRITSKRLQCVYER